MALRAFPLLLALGAFWLPVPAMASHLDQAFVADGGIILRASSDVPRWGAVASRAAAEAARFVQPGCGAQETDASGPCRFAAWQATLARLRDRAPLDQIALVQHAINQLTYVSDMNNWGETDKWETPLEMFERGGDCEDFALTKYFALRSLGIADDAMRIAVVWDVADQEEHAILLVRAEGALWLLDNKVADIEPAERYSNRYRLIYSLNAQGVRLARAPLAGGGAPSGFAHMRIINGGRTLALSVHPRRRKAQDITPAIAMPSAGAGSSTRVAR